MILSATEVAVKEFAASSTTRKMVLYEARVMNTLCCGDPNLPIFFGLYDFTRTNLPLLVTKYYSVAGKPLTLHYLMSNSSLRKKHNLHVGVREWARIFCGICCAVEKMHEKKFLHNDIKGDNVVLSDVVPVYKNSPPLWPVLIDFGKARHFSQAKRYKLDEEEKAIYETHHQHLAPELIAGTHPQSTRTDVYSLGRLITKVGNVLHSCEFLEVHVS